MKNTKRKGFTIVELVIVIAVIAILAAVLIPTFASLVKKANQSSDIQAAKNMNTALVAESAGKEIGSLQDVLKALKASGIDADSHKALSDGYKFVWDSELNRILYVDPDNKVVYPDEYKEVAYKPDKWVNLTGERAGDDSWYKGEGKGESLSNNQYTAGETTFTLGADAKKYTIENAYQLVSFAQIVNADENKGANMVIELKENTTYDMLGAEWDVISEFAGIFNGKGATIKNLAIKDEALKCDTEFASMTNNTYRPFGFISVFTGSYFGDVTLEVDIDNPGTLELTNNHTVAGAIGAVYAINASDKVIIDNVTVNGTINAPFRAAGVVGFVGRTSNNKMAGTVTIQNCTNNASITSELCYSSYNTAAGIVSTSNQIAAGGKLEVQNCTNNGAISGSCVAGIMANCFSADTGTVLVHDNTNSGNITVKHVCPSNGETHEGCHLADQIMTDFNANQTNLYVYCNPNVSGTVVVTDSGCTTNRTFGESAEESDHYHIRAPQP